VTSYNYDRPRKPYFYTAFFRLPTGKILSDQKKKRGENNVTRPADTLRISFFNPSGFLVDMKGKGKIRLCGRHRLLMIRRATRLSSLFFGTTSAREGKEDTPESASVYYPIFKSFYVPVLKKKKGGKRKGEDPRAETRLPAPPIAWTVQYHYASPISFDQPYQYNELKRKRKGKEEVSRCQLAPTIYPTHSVPARHFASIL